MAMNANFLADEGGDPVGVEVIGVEVGEAAGADVGEAHPGAVEALGGDARADAEVDEQDACGATQECGVAERAAGENAKFQGHPCRLMR